MALTLGSSGFNPAAFRRACNSASISVFSNIVHLDVALGLGEFSEAKPRITLMQDPLQQCGCATNSWVSLTLDTSYSNCASAAELQTQTAPAAARPGPQISRNRRHFAARFSRRSASSAHVRHASAILSSAAACAGTCLAI